MQRGVFWSIVYVVGLATCIVGGISGWIAAMALGSAIAGVGYAGVDLTNPRESSITPLTVHALFAGVWMGLSHFIAGFVVDTQYEKTFYGYSDFAYLSEAQYLATMTAVVPLVAGRFAERRLLTRAGVRSPLPSLTAEFADGKFLLMIWLLVLVDVTGVLFATTLAGVPIIGPLLRVGVLGAIFMLTWHWFGPSPSLPRWTRYLLVALIVLKMLVALLFNDMRGEIVYPLYAMALAIILRRAVKRWMVLAVIVFLIPFSYVYSIIGGIKGQGIVGSERVALILGERPGQEEAGEDSPIAGAVMTLAARSCNFGQLSQVVRVADEDGFYYGETISYLVYIFIPRAVWPEKPEVTPGQWFARRLGKGMQLSETRFSNSINMTLAGEFYLNFGWLAAGLGLALYGVLLSVCWSATGIFTTRNNVVGLALAFLLLMQGSYASSAAALVQIVIGYGSMFAAHMVIMHFGNRGKRGAHPPGPLRRVPARPVGPLRSLDAAPSSTGDPGAR